jgi:hypothetical protein
MCRTSTNHRPEQVSRLAVEFLAEGRAFTQFAPQFAELTRPSERHMAPDGRQLLVQIYLRSRDRQRRARDVNPVYADQAMESLHNAVQTGYKSAVHT